MRIFLLSDIHANLEALNACLDAAPKYDCAVNLGDVVGYGADPNDCCALVRRHAGLSLAGNHDLAVTGELPLDEFSRGAALAARWTQEVLERGHVEWLTSLHPTYENEALGLYHASPRDPIWEYVLNALLAELCLDAAGRRLCVVGHSHVALSFVRRDGEATTGEARKGGDTAELAGAEWLINPGSVGQPRDGDPRAAWLLLDADTGHAEWRRVEYDVAGAQRAIRAAHLPDSLAERLQYGQ